MNRRDWVLASASLAGLPESCQFLPDLVIDLYVFAFVLPLGKLRMVELLLQFGRHGDQFLLLGSALVDQLLGSAAGGG